MIVLDYRITALSRISAGAGPEVLNSRSVHDVIPGGVVRGALATAHARGHGFDWSSERLRRIFERASWFTQAVPRGWELTGLSAVRCKYPDHTSSRCENSRYDVAWRVATDRKIDQTCPACGGPWDRKHGWRPGQDQDADWEVGTTRTALTGGVAKDEQLFTRRAIRQQTELRGTVRLDDSLLDEDDLSWLTTDREVRIGGQRSVLGSARWTATRADPAAGSGDGDPAGPVVLRFQSPTILTDAYGASSLDVESALRTAFGAGLTVIGRWLRPMRVSGWHMASGLPKPEEWALVPGSTVVVENAPANLAERIGEGLGLRRREGFGALALVPEPATADTSAVDEGRRVTEEELRELVEVTAGQRPAPEDETSTEATDESAVEPVDDSPEALRRSAVGDVLEVMSTLVQPSPQTAVKGLLSGLAQVRMYRQNGFPSSIVSGVARNVLQVPWAVSLTPTALDVIRPWLAEESAEEMAEVHAELRRQAVERGLL